MKKRIIAIILTLVVLTSMCVVASADMKKVKLPDSARLSQAVPIKQVIRSFENTTK